MAESQDTFKINVQNMNQQEPSYPPPPYSAGGTTASAEYGKPPPYFEPGRPATTPATAAPIGFYPPPPHQTQVTHESHQNAGGRAGGPTVIAVTTVPAGYVATTQPQQQVLLLGDCPSCRIGFLRSEFDICGIILAILFFPIGILCCLCMMERRCSHCGARF